MFGVPWTHAAYLVLTDLDGLAGIILAVKTHVIDGVFRLHSIVHINNLNERRKKATHRITVTVQKTIISGTKECQVNRLQNMVNAFVLTNERNK